MCDKWHALIKWGHSSITCSHPKMTIMSPFTHPQEFGCSKTKCISFLCWTQKKIFWRML